MEVGRNVRQVCRGERLACQNQGDPGQVAYPFWTSEASSVIWDSLDWVPKGQVDFVIIQHRNAPRKE